MKTNSKFIIYLVLSIAAGILIAWNDSRPKWDDTGITASLIVLTAALFGYLYSSRPWVWALAVGMWIPVHAIVANGDFKMTLVALFGLVGSYLGAAVKNNRPSDSD